MGEGLVPTKVGSVWNPQCLDITLFIGNSDATWIIHCEIYFFILNIVVQVSKGTDKFAHTHSRILSSISGGGYQWLGVFICHFLKRHRILMFLFNTSSKLSTTNRGNLGIFLKKRLCLLKMTCYVISDRLLKTPVLRFK